MKQEFQFIMNCVSVNVDLMEMYVIQSMNGIMVNVYVNVINQINWISCKSSYLWNPSTCNCEWDKTFEIGENLDIKNCACKERVFGKLN